MRTPDVEARRPAQPSIAQVREGVAGRARARSCVMRGMMFESHDDGGRDRTSRLEAATMA